LANGDIFRAAVALSPHFGVFRAAYMRNLLRRLKELIGRSEDMKRPGYLIELGEWQPGQPCLEEWLEAGCIRVGNRLYVMGGYQTLTQMCTRMQIFDIESGEWTYGPPLPAGFPLTHAGVATDGKYIFIVSGQPGPACEHASNRCWALEIETLTWQRLAPLPGARYAPILEYFEGNLHLITGASEDRETISTDHFILKIRELNHEVSTLPDLEKQVWRRGPPIPEGGDHASSIVYDSKIYVIGGEHGHARVTMDAATCCGTYISHTFLFRYDPRKEVWERLADMPFGGSHTEAQVLLIDDRIFVFGGTGDQDHLIDRVQQYDPANNSWREIKELPRPRKGGIVWEWQNRVYFNGGQTLDAEDGSQVVAATMSAEIRRVAIH
jgi:Kelch motif/Galactose oxidase, central domain